MVSVPEHWGVGLPKAWLIHLSDHVWRTPMVSLSYPLPGGKWDSHLLLEGSVAAEHNACTWGHIPCPVLPLYASAYLGGCCTHDALCRPIPTQTYTGGFGRTGHAPLMPRKSLALGPAWWTPVCNWPMQSFWHARCPQGAPIAEPAEPRCFLGLAHSPTDQNQILRVPSCSGKTQLQILSFPT